MTRINISEDLLVSAVRYALGRAVCIVPWTVNETIRVWPHLTDRTRDVIRRDVTEAIEQGCAGAAPDVRGWQTLLNETTGSGGPEPLEGE